MATTTTFDAIRDNYRTLIQAATPAVIPEIKFHECPVNISLEDWAGDVGVGSACFRAFQFRRSPDELNEPGHMDPSAFEREETMDLLVSYPNLPALYGENELDELEAIIHSDATQLRKLIFGGENYLAGQSAAWVIPEDITRGDYVWYLPIQVRLVYTEGQTLT